MKAIHFRFALCVATAFASAPAAAQSLLGDTLTFQRYFPNLSTPIQGTQTTVVVAGTSDTVTIGAPTSYATMNPEANTINYFTTRVTSFGGTSTITDAIRITGFRQPVSFASIVSNSTGLALTLTYSPSDIIINMNGSQNVGGSYLISVNAVPEPATAVLMASGAFAMLLLAGRTRRRAG